MTSHTDNSQSVADHHYAISDLPPRANTDHVKRKLLDVPYACTSPAQKLDICLPDEGDGPFPVIVSIWQEPGTAIRSLKPRPT